MNYAYKFSDLVILNLWVVFTSIPIVTVGASAAAMHYVLLKIYRDEPIANISLCYCRAFRDNFKQATIIWIAYIFVNIFIGFDLYLLHQNILSFPAIVTYALFAIAVFLIFCVNWALILQSRYENHILKTIKNSVLFSFFHFWDTILIGIFSCLPLLLSFLIPKAVPVVFICGFTASGILQTSFYNRIFKKHEHLTDIEERKD